MRRFLRLRPIASTLILVFAVVSSAECLTAGLSAEQKACCAAMQHDCGKMRVESSCCTGDVENLQGLTATKPSVGLLPVVALVAILTTPLTPIAVAPRASVPDLSSIGPPGVPTYLFVSSFRI
jgi:hypothetical protein